MTFTLCRVSQTKLLAEVSRHGPTTDSYWLLSVALGVFRDPTIHDHLPIGFFLRGLPQIFEGFIARAMRARHNERGGIQCSGGFQSAARAEPSPICNCSASQNTVASGPTSDCINRFGFAFQYSEWFPVGGEGKAPAEPLSCHSEYCSIWLGSGVA